MKRLLISSLCLTLSAPAAAESLRVLALRTDAFFNEQEGRTVGIEYGILEYFAKSRDTELEIEWVGSFPELLDRIEKGEGDIAAGTITITTERSERMDFSAPYFPVQVVVVERVDEVSQSLGELAGAKVGAFRSTTAEDALRVEPGIEVVFGGSLREMLDDVVQGKLRAAAADSSSVIPVLEDYPSLEITLTLGKAQHFGFALPKGSPLKEPLSAHIARLKESGIYFYLVSDHLGPRASEIVRAARAP